MNRTAETGSAHHFCLARGGGGVTETGSFSEERFTCRLFCFGKRHYLLLVFHRDLVQHGVCACVCVIAVYLLTIYLNSVCATFVFVVIHVGVLRSLNRTLFLGWPTHKRWCSSVENAPPPPSDSWFTFKCTMLFLGLLRHTKLSLGFVGIFSTAINF